MGRSRQPRPKKLAKKLKDIRLNLGLTQKEMFERLKEKKIPLYLGHISLFETGQRIPSLLVLLKYARVGSTSMEAIVDDELSLY
jgi:transcriptional regulator with XRE-family HTH domain